jgi:hypothetical protein
MRRDWETRLVEEPEYNSRKKKCAEFSKEATPEVTKEEPIPEKFEQEHIKITTTLSVDFVVPNETNKRSMSSAKPLREFEPMDWVPIDYGEVFDKRRPIRNQKGMARALEVDFLPEKKAENSYDLETTGEIFQKLFGDDEVDPEHIAEVKRIMGIKPESITIRSPRRNLCDRIRRRREDGTILELRDQRSSMESFMRHQSPSKCPCRMDLPGPTASMGTRTDYSVGPWDYPTCAARYLLA